MAREASPDGINMQLIDAGIGNADQGTVVCASDRTGQAFRVRTRSGRDAASAPSDRRKGPRDQVCHVVAWGRGKKDGG